MKQIRKIINYLRRNFRTNFYRLVTRKKLGFNILSNPVRNNLQVKKFDSSYYGGPYPYDWNSSEFALIKA